MNGLYRLIRDKDGASAVEFAFAFPLVLMLVMGTLNFGVYYQSENALDDALLETGRYAALYPTPTDAALQSKFQSSLLNNGAMQNPSLVITHGTGAANASYVDLAASATQDINLLLVSYSGMPIAAQHRAYLAQ